MRRPMLFSSAPFIRMTLTVSILLFIPFAVDAQKFSNFRFKKIATGGDTLQLDTLSIVPGSFVIDELSTGYYLNYEDGFLVLNDTIEIPDSVTVSYRVFPFYFYREYFNKNPKLIEPDAKGFINPFTYNTNENSTNSMDFGTLNKQGSISRGVSFGNNQDLSVNSNLNLQISGKISDNVNVLAAVTDDNIPIQPDGNTQQLQDFDQVYIQLFDEKTKLTVGDFQLRSKESGYLKYFKKAKGGSVESSFTPGIDKKDKLTVQASGAISRGKFARNIIQGVEGNQGPYRLIGDENESFIIILSGTERVFIDGIQLERGQENDYSIDYNTAEVTFTAKRLITKDKRIIIEFQYSDKNYERWLAQFNTEYETEKLNLKFNFFNEQDSKNRTFQSPLTDNQKAVLTAVGDSLNEAFSGSYDSIGYSPNRVLYELTIHPVSGDTIFVFSTIQSKAVYQVNFSNVGFENGDYFQLTSTANGRVYEWIAPDTIDGRLVHKGNYEPVTLLITPKQRQMITLGGEYDITKTTTLNFEGALSKNDLNVFSPKDDGDNTGFAFKIGVTNEKHLIENETNPLNLVTTIGYERVDKQFREIERFRTVEFDRDWNVRNVVFKEIQHLPEASVGIVKKEVGTLINYKYGSYISERNEFNGTNHFVTSNFNTHGFSVDMKSSHLSSKSRFNNTLFMRNKCVVSKDISIFKVGFRDDFEDNRYFFPSTDSLLRNSYGFFEWEVFVRNVDTLKNEFNLSYTRRVDNGVENNSLKTATLGESVTFGFGLLKNPNSRLRFRTTYRELKIVRDELTSQVPDNTLLNRIEYEFRLFKGAITSSSFYEVGSGLEVKKEYSYIEVTAGQGTHAWKDHNNDSVQTIDEFEETVFKDEARYIKLFTPTLDYIKVYTNQFNQSLTIRPAAIWNNKGKFKKFVSRFSDQFAYRIDRKTNFEKVLSSFNPFREEIADTSLVSLSKSFRNSFYFNRTDPVFGMIFNYQKIDSKTLLTNGFESRFKEFEDIDVRINISRSVMINLVGEIGRKANLSEFLPSRNYRIDYWKTDPKLTFQPGTAYRASVQYTYSEKQNRPEFGGEKAVSKNIGGEFRYNTVGKGSIQLNANLIYNTFKNDEGSDVTTNSSIAFEMLESLQSGQNYTWTVSWQRTLANNVQLNLNYNGRKSETVKTIHSGGVEVRAFF